MNQIPPTFKCFEPRPGHTPCLLPPPIERLVGAQALPAYFGLADLREMSKFLEIPNVHGLAAYPIERPEPEEPGLVSVAAQAELLDGADTALARELFTHAWVMTRGTLPATAGPDARQLIQIILPQTHAHLAAVFGRMLHPWPAENADAAAGLLRADLTMLVWPRTLFMLDGTPILESFIGHWPGAVVVVGHDDPALLIRLILADGRARPEWIVPLQSAVELAATAEGRRRALGLGSWLVGVRDDGLGHFPIFEQDAGESDRQGGGWVVAPFPGALPGVPG
jgi:hypothetical protein